MKTLNDIAKKCGVSASTVSRVLNNEPGISRETRTLVLSTAEKYNFSLQKRKKPISRSILDLVIVIPDENEIAGNPFYEMTELLSAINSVFGETRKKIETMAFSEFSRALNNASFRYDGILFAFGSIDKKIKEQLLKMKVPYIFLNRTFLDDNYVCCNNYKGVLRLYDFLYNEGHRIIGYLGYESHPVNVDRYRGFQTGGLEYFNSDNSSLALTVSSIDKISRDTARFFIEKKCDAVISFNDNFAIRLIPELESEGAAVPEAISITGFDNSPMRRLFKPAITTINLSTFEMAFLATQWLRDNILDRSLRILHCEIEGELIHGDSVKTRRHNGK